MNNIREADFWIDRVPDPDKPLLAPDQIEAFNRRVYLILGMSPVLDLPDVLDRTEVEAQMRAFIPTAPRYDARGQVIEPEFYERFLEGLDLPDPVPVRFGLITHRAEVRAFPTNEVVTARPFEYALDQFQETSADVGWPVAILVDREMWHFCLTPFYWGWIHSGYFAYGTREQVANYVQAEPFAVTVDGRGLVARPSEGGIVLQMGTRLPLRAITDQTYQFAVPQWRPDGRLEMTEGLASRKAGQFHEGYLPCTLRTLFTQAFSLLSERYAWGDSRMGIFGRDCSRFVQDVFGVTGIRLPRNASQQAQVGQVQAVFSPEMIRKTRRDILINSVSPGALLFMPGHVMLYLGSIDGEPYIIHDTHSELYSEVVVSPVGALLLNLTQAVTIEGLSS